jgi:hypothetical protein
MCSLNVCLVERNFLQKKEECAVHRILEQVLLGLWRLKLFYLAIIIRRLHGAPTKAVRNVSVSHQISKENHLLSERVTAKADRKRRLKDLYGSATLLNSMS